MQISSTERRSRLEKLAQQDDDYQQISREWEKENLWFKKITDRLPRKLRQRFWGYPTMQHFLFNRLLTLACQNMRFPDEEQQD